MKGENPPSPSEASARKVVDNRYICAKFLNDCNEK